MGSPTQSDDVKTAKPVKTAKQTKTAKTKSVTDFKAFVKEARKHMGRFIAWRAFNTYLDEVRQVYDKNLSSYKKKGFEKAAVEFAAACHTVYLSHNKRKKTSD